MATYFEDLKTPYENCTPGILYPSASPLVTAKMNETKQVSAMYHGLVERLRTSPKKASKAIVDALSRFQQKYLTGSANKKQEVIINTQAENSELTTNNPTESRGTIPVDEIFQRYVNKLAGRLPKQDIYRKSEIERPTSPDYKGEYDAREIMQDATVPVSLQKEVEIRLASRSYLDRIKQRLLDVLDTVKQKFSYNYMDIQKPSTIEQLAEQTANKDLYTNVQPEMASIYGGDQSTNNTQSISIPLYLDNNPESTSNNPDQPAAYGKNKDNAYGRNETNNYGRTETDGYGRRKQDAYGATNSYVGAADGYSEAAGCAAASTYAQPGYANNVVAFRRPRRALVPQDTIDVLVA